jgi:hypothetical protein
MEAARKAAEEIEKRNPQDRRCATAPIWLRGVVDGVEVWSED